MHSILVFWIIYQRLIEVWDFALLLDATLNDLLFQKFILSKAV